jgi:hypothetical protein
MANPEHLEILKQGVEVWNQWREDNPEIRPDLSQVNLSRSTLTNYRIIGGVIAIYNWLNFNGVDLQGADLGGADISFAKLSRANLSKVNLTKADLKSAELEGANFNGAQLQYANFKDSQLSRASFREARLWSADFTSANLCEADFTLAKMQWTIFGNNNLSTVKGLDSVIHDGPSEIGINTLYYSAGKIPEAFLRGCGIPEDFITFIPSHFGIQQAIQFYSCFISYSTRDEEFARRLYSRMRDEKLRVWFAPEEMKGGQKLYEQIERAIQLHDRLLLVLSESSMQSEWVITEIQRARETELKEGRRKLFPITIAEFDKVKAWRRFDADTGKDLAKEVREYFIPDFSNWKDHDAFEKAFERLLRDLRAEEARA